MIGSDFFCIINTLQIVQKPFLINNEEMNLNRIESWEEISGEICIYSNNLIGCY